MNHKNKLFIATFTIACVLLVSFSLTYKRENLSVGLILPLSGQTAAISENLRDGASTAFKQADLGEALRTEDSRELGGKGTLAAYNKLILENKNMKALIGPLGPQDTLALAGMKTLQKNLPIFAVTNCDPRLQDFSQIYCAFPSLRDQTLGISPLLLRLNISSMSIVTEPGDLGDQVTGAAEELTHQTKVTIDNEYLVSNDKVDMKTIAIKIVASKTQSVLIATYPGKDLTLIKELHLLGYQGTILLNSDHTEETLRSLGDATKGIYLPSRISTKYDAGFTKTYKELFNKGPDLYAALGHSIASKVLEVKFGKNVPSAIPNFNYKQKRVIVPFVSFYFDGNKLNEIDK